MIFNFKNENNLEKVINSVVIFTLIIAIPITIWEQNWINLFLVSLTLFLIFESSWIQKKYNFHLPGELQLVLIVFIYGGIFLGGVHDFYYRFWWFDSLLHAISGLGLGFIGFLIPYSLYKIEKIKTNPFFIALFGFCFALSLGVLWEIFEFLMDELLNYNMQKARNLEIIYGQFDTRLGIIDTMYDLILDSIGAFIASIIGYLYLKNGEFYIFDKIIKEIEKLNPKYFK